MPPAKAPSSLLRWSRAALRVLLVSFLLALLAFAGCLFLGIVGLLISASIRGIHPNMTLAYREVALPAALAGGTLALLATIVMEVRHGRRERNKST